MAEGHRVRRKCGIHQVKAVIDPDHAEPGRPEMGCWFGFKKSKNHWEVVNRRAMGSDLTFQKGPSGYYTANQLEKGKNWPL